MTHLCFSTWKISLYIEKRPITNCFLAVEKLQFKSLSSSICLFTHKRIDSLNVLHAMLNLCLFFKKHINSWHDISSLVLDLKSDSSLKWRCFCDDV